VRPGNARTRFPHFHPGFTSSHGWLPGKSTIVLFTLTKEGLRLSQG